MRTIVTLGPDALALTRREMQKRRVSFEQFDDAR
jgi:hypothetical protein